jgi:hypothetical protein
MIVPAKPGPDFDLRVRQAKALAQLAGMPNMADADDPQTFWGQVYSQLVLFGLDHPLDWSGLSDMSWVLLLKRFPELSVKVPDWSLFSTQCCWELLWHQPQLIGHLPQVHTVPGTWGETQTYEGVWVELLWQHPQLAEHMRQWASLSGRAWSKLLQVQPQLSKHLPDWDRLSKSELVALLQKQPQLLEQLPKPCPLDGVAWGQLLRTHPQLADKVPDWQLLSCEDWLCLLEQQPQLSQYVPVDKRLYVVLKRCAKRVEEPEVGYSLDRAGQSYQIHQPRRAL